MILTPGQRSLAKTKERQITASPSPNQPPIPSRTERRLWFAVVALAVMILLWAVVSLTSHYSTVLLPSDKAQIAIEGAGALARLFGALVLFMFPKGARAERMCWVAGGLVVSGLGGFFFGSLAPVLDIPANPNMQMYATWLVRTVSGAMFMEGLLPRTPAPFTRRTMLITLCIFAALTGLVVMGTNLLPPFVQESGDVAARLQNGIILRAVTPWHYVLSAIPLALTGLATFGAVRRFRTEKREAWLVFAMELLVGAQLHYIFWPSTYTTVVSSVDILRLLSAVAVVVGGVVELRRIASEHAALLLVEQEQTRRLTDLTILKADFTAMVAHELGNPLAAIRGFADVMATGRLNPKQQQEALAVIQSESRLLTTLIADVQVAANVERDDFAVRPNPVPLKVLIADAAAYAGTLPGDHPFSVIGATDAIVRADEYRIGQVLHNLLSNAAKYSPDGTPIELRVRVDGGRAFIEVCDHGNGIPPNDLTRIFEKFGRGRDTDGQKVPGIGLGLYLSRRIIRAHGGDIAVQSTLGIGTVFGFELEVVR